VARKQRLKALKQAAAEASQKQAAEQQASEPPQAPVLKFRNYHVRDQKRIDHEQVAPAQPPKLEEPVIESKPEDADPEELLMNVAPKKPNWDLKRDLQGKLDKLERRTQRAIIEIMNEEARARLEEDGGIQD